MTNHPSVIPPGSRITVGLSGGVDSAVAALLLQEQGYRVHGLFMKNWEEDDEPGYCAAEADLRDARAVAEKLRIPLDTVNFSADYWDRVFQHFLHEYRSGRTPNPDVLCNREIKFKAFLDYALQRGADAIATGHYARLRHDEAGCHLCRCRDADKDQTYFLYLLGQQALRRVLFPLAELTKQQVREKARLAGLDNYRKKDSTGICFIGERRFRDFLKRYLPAQPGPIVSDRGRQLGEHQGLMYYTLGQRQGLGIGGQAQSAELPWYVVYKDLSANRLVVAQGHDHPLLFRQRLRLVQLHWINGIAAPTGVTLQARIRHRQPLQCCRLCCLEGDAATIAFDQPQRAATPGQSVVIYRNEECLGGGIIDDLATE